MTVAEVKKYLREIRAYAKKGAHAHAHRWEDWLYLDVLLHVAKRGDAESRKLASEALKAYDLTFYRCMT